MSRIAAPTGRSIAARFAIAQLKLFWRSHLCSVTEYPIKAQLPRLRIKRLERKPHD